MSIRWTREAPGIYRGEAPDGSVYQVEELEPRTWFLTYPGCRTADDVYLRLRDAKEDAEHHARSKA